MKKKLLIFTIMGALLVTSSLVFSTSSEQAVFAHREGTPGCCAGGVNPYK
ncbi:hypothetical protein [Tumebacillus lipolyticus]|uniref:Uncharacterized protein n=1 Tax=Tumebacillus lipolyticus TaxID=1280370 RepID=A0ABW4ZS55_9BACL